MSIERVLSKIVQHNEPILGCILLNGSKVHHNLPDRYELIDVLDVAENAESIFELAGSLDTGPHGFDQVFLEFEEYSFFARRMEEGVLVLLSKPIERSAFKKLQVGVNLFMKPLRRELTGSETVEEPKVEPQSTEVPQEESKEEKPKSKRMYRGIRY